MFALPAGWTIRGTQPAIELVGAAGRIVVEEGVRPFDRARMFDELAGANAEHLVTCEGELAALVRAGSAVEGFVFLDDSYVRAVGTGELDQLGVCMRELVVGMRFYLGPLRRRWFRYQPPSGWRRAAAPSGDETWLGPADPDHRSSLTVPWALPSYARAEASLVKTLLGLAEVAGEADHVPLVVGALAGYRWERAHDGMAIVVAGLSEGQYDYFVRLIAPAGTDLDVLDRVLASIEPIPSVSVRSADAVGFWCS